MTRVDQPATPWCRPSVTKLAVCVAAALALTACGGDKKDKPASQVAAKVNKEELSVHQINYVLQRQPGMKQDQAAAASRQVLERLIDQELALQKAAETKIERDPKVLQAIDAARREIVARAYFEKIGETATKPSADEVHKYYEDQPALFKDRRIYNFQELAIEAKPEQLDGLRNALKSAKTMPEFVDYLKANDFKFSGNQAVRAAEQVPLANLTAVSQMKDGESMFNPTPTGAQIVMLAGSRSQPITEDRARPAIEQYLLNDRKRKLVEADLKALRAAAKIEYVGDFAKPAASAPSGDVPAAASSPSGAASSVDIEKGLKGL